MPVTEFLANYYDQEACLIPEITPDRNFNILTEYDTRAWLHCYGGTKNGAMEFCRNGNLMAEDILKSVLLNLDDNIIERVMSSWTLIMNRIDISFGLIRRLNDHLAKSLSTHVWTNAYVTPPHNKGFTRHADSHDVFIWQIEGAKRWQIFATYDPNDDNPVAEFRMNKGQLLYIPEGIPHSAESVDSTTSIHLTIGFRSERNRLQQTFNHAAKSWQRSNWWPRLTEKYTASRYDAATTTQTLLQLIDDFREWASLSLPEEFPHTNRTRFSPPLDSLEIISALNAKSDSVQPTAPFVSQDCTLRTKDFSLSFREPFREAVESFAQTSTANVGSLPLTAPKARYFIRMLVSAGAARPEVLKKVTTPE